MSDLGYSIAHCLRQAMWKQRRDEIRKLEKLMRLQLNEQERQLKNLTNNKMTSHDKAKQWLEEGHWVDTGGVVLIHYNDRKKYLLDRIGQRWYEADINGSVNIKPIPRNPKVLKVGQKVEVLSNEFIPKGEVAEIVRVYDNAYGVRYEVDGWATDVPAYCVASVEDTEVEDAIKVLEKAGKIKDGKILV